MAISKSKCGLKQIYKINWLSIGFYNYEAEIGHQFLKAIKLDNGEYKLFINNKTKHEIIKSLPNNFYINRNGFLIFE